MSETHCVNTRPCRLCREKRARSPVKDIQRSICGKKGWPQPMKLKPIIVADPTDHVAIRRARNTMAARRARQRKTDCMSKALSKTERLTFERDHYKIWSQFYHRFNPQIRLPIWVDEDAIPADQPDPVDQPAPVERAARATRRSGSASTRYIIPDVLPSVSSSTNADSSNTMSSSNVIGFSNDMDILNTMVGQNEMRE